MPAAEMWAPATTTDVVAIHVGVSMVLREGTLDAGGLSVAVVQLVVQMTMVAVNRILHYKVWSTQGVDLR